MDDDFTSNDLRMLIKQQAIKMKRDLASLGEPQIDSWLKQAAVRFGQNRQKLGIQGLPKIRKNK